MSRSIPKAGRPHAVVLTGGIASGKTEVSNRFARLGVPIIDTDCIARNLVKPDAPALHEIVTAFGRDVLLPGGGLDRRRLRDRIFSDPHARALLESILHPRIAQEVRIRITSITEPYCIVVIPLFAESSAYDWVDRVLVVNASVETQIERVMTRDHIDRQEAEAILRAQSSREQRLALADDVIDNSGGLDDLEQQVRILHARYLELFSPGHAETTRGSRQ